MTEPVRCDFADACDRPAEHTAFTVAHGELSHPRPVCDRHAYLMEDRPRTYVLGGHVITEGDS
jgi:hypothetical protein